MSVQERVARGARWLDGVRPGWRDALELRRLHIRSATNCVLGQVFADEAAADPVIYASGFDYAVSEVVPAVMIDEADAACWFTAHGFADGETTWGGLADFLVAELDSEAPRAEHVALADEWRRIIHVPRDECASAVRL